MRKYMEPGLIGLALLVSAFFITSWPQRLSTGSLILVFSAVFLTQTLIRDLALLYRQKTRSKGRAFRTAQCFCVESGVGIICVLAGVILLLGNYGAKISLDKTAWLFGLALVMAS